MRRCGVLFGVVLALLLCVPLQTAAETALDDTVQTLIGISGEELSVPDPAQPVPALPDVLDKGKSLLLSSAGAPLRMLELLFAVILLSALAQSLRQGEGTGAVYECVCTLCAVTMLADPLIAAFPVRRRH